MAQETKNKIYLARHGETAWSLSGQHTGLSDIPLTPNGEKQALSLKIPLNKISFAKVFSSPLIRAKHTAEIAGFKEKIELHNGLIEWNYGKYEGMTTPDIRKIDPDWTVFSKGAPNGESIDDVTKRAKALLDLAQTINGNVLLFGSGHILRAIGAIWLGMNASGGKYFKLSTASISILGWERENKVIEEWNCTDHYKTN